jgi:HK97 family phage major capsid protein
LKEVIYMPQTTPEWRAEAPEVELRARATAMRGEWAELSKLDRESDDYGKGKTQFLDEISDLDTQLTLRQMETPSVRRAPAGALGGVPEGQEETRSPGQVVSEHEGFRTWARQNAGRDHLESGSPTIEVRDLVSLGASTNLLLPVLQPALIGVRRKRFFLRNLMSVVSVTQAAIPYVRELNAVANQDAATTVPESTQSGTPVPKPQAKIEFTTDLAHVATIAVNIPITTQMLEDSTFIQAYVDARLPYLLAVREEQQLLNGDGAGSNIRGILNTPGIQTQAATAGDPAISIMNAMVKIEVLDTAQFADAVAMNPVDAAALFTKRAAGGSGTFDAGTPFSDLPLNVWGLPVVKTNGVTAGHAIVANWQLGATVLDRRSASVRVYEQHADYVIYNKVLVQAEERVGIMVTNPDYFVVTAL